METLKRNAKAIVILTSKKKGGGGERVKKETPALITFSQKKDVKPRICFIGPTHKM